MNYISTRGAGIGERHTFSDILLGGLAISKSIDRRRSARRAAAAAAAVPTEQLVAAE